MRVINKTIKFLKEDRLLYYIVPEKLIGRIINVIFIFLFLLLLLFLFYFLIRSDVKEYADNQKYTKLKHLENRIDSYEKNIGVLITFFSIVVAGIGYLSYRKIGSEIKQVEDRFENFEKELVARGYNMAKESGKLSFLLSEKFMSDNDICRSIAHKVKGVSYYLECLKLLNDNHFIHKNDRNHELDSFEHSLFHAVSHSLEEIQLYRNGFYISNDSFSGDQKELILKTLDSVTIDSVYIKNEETKKGLMDVVKNVREVIRVE